MTIRLLLACLLALPGLAAAGPPAPIPAFEDVPANEAANIQAVIALTLKEMKDLYANATPPLRGVHPKDHGCVTATFEVLPDLDAKYRVGVFSEPGRKYEAFVRYSNAGDKVTPDSPPKKDQPQVLEHASRGMAIKLLGVTGDRLVERDEPLTQDFLLINQPVFAIANVEDYLAFRQNPGAFFTMRGDRSDLDWKRAQTSFGIVRRIKSLKMDGETGAFETPPARPDENKYFSGAPYLFGRDRAAKFRVAPVVPQSNAEPDMTDPQYLRTALAKRLATGEKPIELLFQVLVKTADEVKGHLDPQIENACTLWPEDPQKYVTLARITIMPQDFNAPAAVSRCESLFFTPWHGVKEHQPLGGINRMKLSVYEASSAFRHLSKEPAKY